MQVPLSWLKEYVDNSEEVDDLAEKLLLSGTKVENIFKKEGETVFDFEITPNRADCLGVIGIAREIAVLYNQSLKIPEPFGETYRSQKGKSISLKVKDKDLCPYFTYGVIDNLKVQDSSEWLQKRLELSGIRPVNNIVDITNYVMVETAQPMHAFDFDKIKGALLLREVREGEKVTTLDGVERTLNKGAIIIEDSEKLVDLAGLMGGENSQVDKDTTTIVLHVPIYSSVAIRHTSQFTNLRSEASNRFEKQLDPNGHRYAFERALHLLKIEAGGSLSSDIKSINYPYKSDSFSVSVEKIQRILGVEITQEEMLDILSSLGFEIMPSPSLDERKLELRAPTWRPDVKITEDVAEEVGRIWGYNRFPKTLPQGKIPTQEDSFLPDWAETLREIIQASGFSETYSHAMTDYASVVKVGSEPKDTLKVVNRMTVDYEYMRPTLLIGLLQSISLNLNNYPDVGLFELGRVFSKKIDSKTKLPYQPRHLSALATQDDFLSIKGGVEKTLNTFGVKKYEFYSVRENKIWSGNSTVLKIGNIEVGFVGEVNRSVLENFSINRKVSGFELNFDELVKAANREIRYQPLAKFPVVREDISVVVEKNINIQQILSTVNSVKETKIKSVSLAEVIAWQGKKSVLLNLVYYDQKKTMTDKEAAQIRKKITDVLRKDLKAEIRSK